MCKKTLLITALAAALVAGGALPAYAGHGSEVWGTQLYARNAGLLSESEVIRQVKRQYDAEILRIDYDERRQVYRVRVLMPNGKVRKLTISARH